MLQLPGYCRCVRMFRIWRERARESQTVSSVTVCGHPIQPAHVLGSVIKCGILRDRRHNCLDRLDFKEPDSLRIMR